MYDIATDHSLGLIAAIVCALAGVATIFILRLLARLRFGRASALLARYEAAPLMARMAAAMMLLSAAVHLALVPGHDGITGILFLIDGLGFIGLAIAAFTASWWRRPAALWLSATIVAYIISTLAGWETPDQVGIACKLIELIALGLVLRLAQPGQRTWPRRVWRATAYPVMASITTLGIMLGGLAHPDALHAHAGAVLQPVADVVTPDQREAAARLLALTKVDIAPYRDPAVALAAGYKAGPGSDIDPLVHFENKANAHAVLDPAHPQALVYARTPHGLRLVGAMFQMPRVGQRGPDPGGSLTQWHQHEGICFSPFGIEFSFATPFWTCPIGSTNITTPPMLHVWIIGNGKNGPFSADLDKAVQRQLQQE